MLLKLAFLVSPVIIGIIGFLRWWFRKPVEMLELGIGANGISLIIAIFLFFFGSLNSFWSFIGGLCAISLNVSALICYFDNSNNHDATDDRF